MSLLRGEGRGDGHCVEGFSGENEGHDCFRGVGFFTVAFYPALEEEGKLSWRGVPPSSL